MDVGVERTFSPHKISPYSSGCRWMTFGLRTALLVSKIFNLCGGHDPPTPQTDGQTTCDRKTVLCTIVHRAVKSGGGVDLQEVWGTFTLS